MLFPASYAFSLLHTCCINEGGLAFGQGAGWLFCAGVKRARKASVFSLVPAVPIFYSYCVKLSFFMFYGSGVFGIAFSFPVCLRYKLLCKKLGLLRWVFAWVKRAARSPVCGGGVLGCIFGLNGDGGHVHLPSRLCLLCLLLCDFR